MSVVTPLGANATNGAGSSGTSWTAGSGVTLGTGDIVVFTFTESSGAVANGVTVGGSTASLIGASSSTFAKAWLAIGVSSPTGNVVVSYAGNFQYVSANWSLITGENTSPVFTSNSYTAFNAPSPLSISGTVSVGGTSLVAAMSTVFGTDPNPVTWTNCVTSGNLTLEASFTTGNKIDASGNYSTTTGSVTITGTGTGSFSGTVAEIMMLAFAAGSSGANDVFGGPMHLVQM